MLPLIRGTKLEVKIEGLDMYLVQDWHKIQLFFPHLSTVLSIIIIMLAAFPVKVLEKDAIKLIKYFLVYVGLTKYNENYKFAPIFIRYPII